MSNKKTFYVTTPIYYVNAQPHLGHTYTTIAADVLARYHRMISETTYFMTGTDEHGAKIAEKAAEAGQEPQVFVDEVAAKFQLAWEELNISNDNFIRTTNPKHMAAVSQAMQYMYDKGDIYKSKYEGLYCQGCEQFKNEKDLVDGLCPDHKTKLQWMSEEAYMFKLSAYQDILLEKIKTDKLKIRPLERKNEMISFFEQFGLNDVAFSRQKVKWGIVVPWDESQTVYVWADAFLNYLTGLGWQGPKGEAGLAKEFWPASVQLIGKDIMRVHATIWAAMLLSLDLPTMEQLFVHGFFLSDGQKMSKSLGNVIAPEELVEKYGVDGVRYLLMGVTPFGNDGDITWKFLDDKYNAELANGLGNLVSRLITMTITGYNGLVPTPEADNNYSTEIEAQISEWQKSLENIALAGGLTAVGKIISMLDKQITDATPWKALKEGRTNEPQIQTDFYHWLESLRIIGWLIWPYMPTVAQGIWQSLGLVNESEQAFEVAIKWGGLKPGSQVQKPESLFPRI
ncbi:MAG: methionine--tRNA ligase [Candidatus Falkowbacteria bacterium]